MVRAPCCEKMGLKKGPWTPKEDQILINYIHLHGHGNWRALPKQAGLLRCGKSCRLRWINYLRPDIKRGNFSKEEEETIIELHEKLGNRWSVIAAKLPGRTDNEIKNMWNTQLKKRLIKQNQANPCPLTKQPLCDQFTIKQPELINKVRFESPQHSSSDISSVTSHHPTTTYFPEVDEKFWSDMFSADNSGELIDIPAASCGPQAQFQFQISPRHAAGEQIYGYNSSVHDGLDFWYNLFTAAGEYVPELKRF